MAKTSNVVDTPPADPRRIDERLDIIARAATELDGILAGIAHCVLEDKKHSLEYEQVPAAVRALVLRGIALTNAVSSAATMDPVAGVAETPIEELRAEVEVLRG